MLNLLSIVASTPDKSGNYSGSGKDFHLEGRVIYIMKEIKCAFCKGKGVDPFELLSHLSTCAICGGKGKVKVEEPYIRCAFCQGTGIYPHTRLSCTVCSGKGVVTFKEAAVICQECKGTGQEPLTNLPCLSCGGIGAVKKEEEVYMGQAGKKAEKLVTNPENPE